MKSFRDPATNVLRAWGWMDTNGTDLSRDEPEDFNLRPGEWVLVNDVWEPVLDDWRTPVWEDFKQRREVYLNRSSGIWVDAMAAGDTTLANAAFAFRKGIKDLPADPRVQPDATPTETSLRSAILLCYKQLVAAAKLAAPNASAEFDKVSK